MPNSLVYNETKRALLAGEINCAANDIRAMLLMTNTSADTENVGITKLIHFEDLDEYNGSAYGRVALSGKAVAINSSLNRAQFTSDSIEFGSLGAGSRDVAGVLIYKRVDGSPANDIPLAYVPVDEEAPGDGTPFTVTCPAGGWLQNS